MITTQRNDAVSKSYSADCRIGQKPAGIAAIPQDWTIRTISEIADVKTGPFGSSLHQRDYVDEGTPIITVEHLGERGVIHEGLPLISESDCSRLASYRLKQGDIVFSRVGSVDRNSLISEKEDGWLFSGRLLRVRVTDENVCPAYLSCHFNSEPFKRRVRGVAVGQTMASLNTQILNSVPVVLPPLREQRAIAGTLSDVDESVGALEALIAKKQDIKLGAMQQLLTGETRLPGFEAPWKPTSMGRLGFIYGGLSGKQKDDFGDGNARYVTFMNVLANTLIRSHHAQRVRVKPGESQNRVLKGDLLFNATSETPSELAMGAVMDEEVYDLYLNSFCFGFRIHDPDSCYPLYLAYFFRDSAGRSIVSSLAQGATRYNMSKTQFSSLELSMPEFREQREIANILRDMDAETEALEQRREKTLAIKQGMMQELLTGRTRLI